MLECKTDLKNPRKTWVKTQGNQGRKLEAREKKQRRVFLNYHEYEIIYYTVLKKKSYLLFQWSNQLVISCHSSENDPVSGFPSHSGEQSGFWRSYQTLTLTLTFCAQFPPLLSLPHILQAQSCFRVYITQLLLCNILPQTVIKTKTIHYLTEFPWLRNLGVASLSSGGSRSLTRLQSRWQLGLPSAKKTWRAGGPASKHTQLAVGWRPRFITTWTPPLGSSQHGFPSSEIQLRERTLEKTPTQAFCDLVFKSHTFTSAALSSPLF